MNKSINYLLGPEVLWLVFYMIVFVIIKTSHSPVKSMDSFWVNMAFIVPLVLIPLTFSLYFIPDVIHKWLLLRIWIVGIIGAHYVLSRSLEAHSEGGPGVGTAYIMGMGIVFFMLIAGTIFVLIKFR
ncbi:MAG TPA: hypothetical protein VMZ69_04740 [Saprospiraceae bacterium]|nr:hypothetical protein [Saprospiraceae bacterium]